MTDLQDAFRQSVDADRERRGLPVEEWPDASEDDGSGDAGEQCARENLVGRFAVDVRAIEAGLSDDRLLRKGVIVCDPYELVDDDGNLVELVKLLKAAGGRLEWLVVPLAEMEVREYDPGQVAYAVRTAGKYLWDRKGHARWKVSDDEWALLKTLLSLRG